MNIISKQELEQLKEKIENVKTKKEVLKLVSENDILKSFFVFCKTAKIADSKQLLLQIVSDKLQIFQVKQELETVKKNKSTSKSKRLISEKENSSLFSVYDLLNDKSKYLVSEDYLNSDNVKSVFELDKQKNYKADIYRKLKRFATLSDKTEKTEKEKSEFESLTSYLLDVFNCDSSSQLITVLNNISSEQIKNASEKLANSRVKQYNYLSFDSYVKVLKSYTVALNSNNLSQLEKVLEGFLEFVENSLNPESEQNNAENIEESEQKD